MSRDTLARHVCDAGKACIVGERLFLGSPLLFERRLSKPLANAFKDNRGERLLLAAVE